MAKEAKKLGRLGLSQAKYKRAMGLVRQFTKTRKVKHVTWQGGWQCAQNAMER